MGFHATLYSLVVSQPHKATFAILKRMLQKAMEVLTREKTVPMIVRRLKTVCNAHQILVLDRRKIVQGGTHDTLVTQRGSSEQSLIAGPFEKVKWTGNRADK